MAKKNNKQSNLLSKPILIIGGIILIIVLILGLAYIKNNKSAFNSNPTLKQDNSLYSDIKTKLYKQSDIFIYGSDMKISDLIPTDENTLNKLSCTPSINYQYEIKETLDPEIVSYANAIKNESTKEVLNLRACNDGEKTIVSYSQGQCGGGCITGNIAIFKDNILQKSIQIPNSIQMPYFGCSILQLTKDNDLYLRCAGGDGPGGGSKIDKLNLDTFEVTTLKSCTGYSKSDGSSEINCN